MSCLLCDRFDLGVFCVKSLRGAVNNKSCMYRFPYKCFDSTQSTSIGMTAGKNIIQRYNWLNLFHSNPPLSIHIETLVRCVDDMEHFSNWLANWTSHSKRAQQSSRLELGGEINFKICHQLNYSRAFQYSLVHFVMWYGMDDAVRGLFGGEWAESGNLLREN